MCSGSPHALRGGARAKAGSSTHGPRGCRFAAPRTGSIPIQHRRPCQPKVLQQIHERSQPLLAIGIDVHSGVIEKTLSGAQTDCPRAMLRAICQAPLAVVMKRLAEIAAGIMQYVAAAPVDEFEQAKHGASASQNRI